MDFVFSAGPVASVGGSTFDTSDYRQNTYGVPTKYCDPTKSASGAGTIGDPWNPSQAFTTAVAGDIVGFLPVGAGTPVDLVTTDNDNIPATNPTNEGTSNSNRIIFVTKYAATYLLGQVGEGSIATSTNRSELRHNGTAENGTQGSGDGCAILGSYQKDYITFDGFFIDQAECWMKEDSGTLRAEGCTGVHFKNIVIKGAAHTVYSNAVAYRSGGPVDTVLSNIYIYDFSNSGGLGQPSVFSDQYGDQNFTIEHCYIRGLGQGPFTKGNAGGAGELLNYGVVQYNKIHQCATGIRMGGFQHATNVTEVGYNLVYDCTSAGLTISSESNASRNLLIHHNTFAKMDSADANIHGGIYGRGNGIGTNVIIRDNLFDNDSGDPDGWMIDFDEISSLPATLNYNAYYKNGDDVEWARNGSTYNSIGAWRTATGLEANSVELTSSPFTNRASDIYTVTGGHTAKTASSTGEEVGCYATSTTIGVIT